VSAKTARLRGHHFICLQFYGGEGYSAEFVANLDEVVARAKATPAILVEGADDVCAACPGLSAARVCEQPGVGEAEALRIDALAREVLGASVGDRLTLGEARERLSEDAMAVGRWRFDACGDCEWLDVCEPGWDALLDEA
jgi:hypothetical protein